MIVILLVTVWFHDHRPPMVRVIVAPSAADCEAGGRDLKTKLEALGDVRGVTFACVGAREPTAT